MPAIIQALIGLLSGGLGQKIGTTVANGAAVAATIAAVAPIAMWFLGHKEEVFITVTFGELAFWGAIIFGLVALVLKLAHYTPPPA
jgi:hypothetical protein